ncbi:MAG TPA: hypothetical protein VE842_05000 [Pyrinomonadaceae bacterium]|nr:hypothetical protein [Pyrinomonadaceae bacterium]
MAGYSGTPLARKLGIKEDYRVAILNAPGNFLAELGPLPAAALIVPRLRSSLNLILFFAASQSELRKRSAKLAARLTPDGMLWVAWPKRSSGVPTDLSFEVVQRAGLKRGLVDTKVCAVNEVWSGLRFVVRLRDRPSTGSKKG